MDPAQAVPAGSAVVMVARRLTTGRDALRHYVVVVDGRPVAKVWRGKTVEVPVAAGRHEVSLKLSWCASPTVVVNAGPGEVVRLACEPGPAAGSLRDVTVNRDSYISLDRV